MEIRRSYDRLISTMGFPILVRQHLYIESGGRFKETYELLNLKALKFSPVNKIHIFQCMGKIFCVEFQRYPLKFHTKYLTHTLKDTIILLEYSHLPLISFLHCWLKFTLTESTRTKFNESPGDQPRLVFLFPSSRPDTDLHWVGSK